MTTTFTREGEVFHAWESFVIITCYKCGMPFGVPDHWKTKRQEDQGSFFCPNGHSQHYSKSTAQKLREELEWKERQLQRERACLDQTRAELKAVEKSRSAIKGAHTRTKNRVAKGVCPCCNRHFANLHRHMQNQHPDYTKTETAEAGE